MTAAQELALIDSAIESILSGGVSRYMINGRAADKLDLKALWDRKRELEAAVARSSSGGGFVAVQFRKPE